MIISVDNDPETRRRFKDQLDVIRQRCPDFVDLIQRSVEHTADLVGNAEGTDLLKHSGAFRDLRTISKLFDEAPELDAPERNPDVDKRFRTAVV